MKYNILAYIIKKSGKITFRNLISQFNIKNSELETILHELKLDGKIIQTGNKYCVFPEDNHIGEVSVTRTGKKVVFYNGEKLIVSPNFFNIVVLHDVVSFKVTRNDKGEGVAEVTSIIDRSLGNTTCEVTVNNKGKKKIYNYRDHQEIILPDSVMNTLRAGDVILVNTGLSDEDGYYESNFIKKIGNRNDPNMDEIATAYNYGFDNDYSQEFMEELANLPTSVNDSELTDRHDFRVCPVVTIDGVNTKDMDDAIHTTGYDGDGNIVVYVHISDVSNYVKFNSAMFQRALEKGTSLYENNSVFHMYHPILSNGICSLNPNVDRLTKTVMMKIDKFGKIIDFDICKSVINSQLKMNYDDVDKVLSGECMPEGYKPFANDLKILYEAAMRIKNECENNGKIDIVSTDIIKQYDNNNNVTNVNDAHSTPATELVEYLMIAANCTVAEYIFWSSMPGVYRVHEVPDTNKVNKAIETINTLGFKIRPVSSTEDPKTIQKIVKKLEKSEEFPVLSNIILQFMQRARYTIYNCGHYGIGKEYYCHFTSPIRRLPDTLIHMILDFIFKNEELIDDSVLKNMEETLERMCIHASHMERQSDAAEFESGQRAIIKSMENCIGSEYEAVVLELTPRIKIKVNGVITCLSDKDFIEYFGFDNSRKCFYDRDSGDPLKIASKLIVKLINANYLNQSISVKPMGIIKSKVKKR